MVRLTCSDVIAVKQFFSEVLNFDLLVTEIGGYTNLLKFLGCYFKIN